MLDKQLVKHALVDFNVLQSMICLYFVLKVTTLQEEISIVKSALLATVVNPQSLIQILALQATTQVRAQVSVPNAR
jgi:hypothetical protein